VVLRSLTSAALAGFAVLHLKIAGPHRGIGRHPLSMSDQFYLQAAAGLLLAAAVLLRPRRLVWLASAAFAAGSLAVLVYSRYRTIPVYGLPGGFQESWGDADAKPVAWLEGLALVLSLAGLVPPRRVLIATPVGVRHDTGLGEDIVT
jgi:hypothetical protein